jgi:hypothetical protein
VRRKLESALRDEELAEGGEVLFDVLIPTFQRSAALRDGDDPAPCEEVDAVVRRRDLVLIG